MKSPRFLVIRRDNIGDLVCTTPLISGIRDKHPNGWIGVVANSYNAPVLDGNKDIDAVYAYRKAKHGGTGSLRAAWARVRMLLELRRQRIDYVIVATPADRDRGLDIARHVRARHVVAFVRHGARAPGVDIALPLNDAQAASEVELVWRIAPALGIDGPPPPLKVMASSDVVARVRAAVAENHRDGAGPLVAIHVSARKPSQRWPVEHFAALMRVLHERHAARFVVLWAPGDEHNPTHPGDDAKARQLIDTTVDVPVLAWPTQTLPELVGAIAACDLAVLADGGAMHIAAALGKPLVVLYGDSDPRRWRPWGVRHEALQAPSRSVDDIAVSEVAEAFERLVRRGR
jgi:ADP-heptose:LPS heptosyltransferase